MRCILVFAGPNGSGKSTVIKKHMESPDVPQIYICPDDIAKEYIDIKDEKERYLKAMTEAEKLRNYAMENGISFIFETVLSVSSKIDFLKQAKEKGYTIEAVYITTKSPNINIVRVNKRVLEGEHGVPQDKIVARYYKHGITSFFGEGC